MVTENDLSWLGVYSAMRYWRKSLRLIHSQAAGDLRAYTLCGSASCWPAIMLLARDRDLRTSSTVGVCCVPLTCQGAGGVRTMPLEQHHAWHPQGIMQETPAWEHPLFSCLLCLLPLGITMRAGAGRTPHRPSARTQHTPTSRSRSLASNIMAGQQLAEPQRVYALRSPAAWAVYKPKRLPPIAHSAIHSQSRQIIFSDH